MDQSQSTTNNYPRSAFREALLKSERLRVLILLGALGAAFVLRTARALIAGGHENLISSVMMGGLLGVFIFYELLHLWAIDDAIHMRRDLGKWVWISSIIVETSLPALVIVFVPTPSIEPMYRPLANPAVLGYFLFVSLSILRLDHMLCRISGVAAAFSYLGAAAYLGWRPSLTVGTSLLSPQKAVLEFAIAFIIAGFVTGMLADEVRQHVEASLKEAEARYQLKQMERDLELARSIQLSLLPRTKPDIPGFEIAGWNKPADQTGGDYYDWQLLPNGSVVAVLADVTGHGIGPALLAAVCRAYARANFRIARSLFPAIQQLNSELIGDVGEGRFVTFVAAVCVPDDPHVQLLSAGHAPLFHYAFTADRFEEVYAQAPPLGISPELASDQPKTLELNRGDLLVLATDGFFEWTNQETEQFGFKRLQETVRQSRDKPPSQIISALYSAVIEFSGGTKQSDDLTALVIKRT